MMYRTFYRYGIEPAVFWSFTTYAEATRHLDYHRCNGAYVSRIWCDD